MMKILTKCRSFDDSALAPGHKTGNSLEANTAAATASSSTCMTVSGLHRYAVKGLSGDQLTRVDFDSAGDTFPDDRRFALLLESAQQNYKPGEWLHKENFLCAFSDPEFLAQFKSNYRIEKGHGSDGSQRRLLTLKSRSTGQIFFDEIDLQQPTNRERFAEFMSTESGKKVHCITSNSSSNKHTHQFGNTSSGYKQRNDTRTVHIINQATIDDIQNTLQLPFLQATRFRPNIVIQGPPAWSEFDWVANKQQLLEPESGLTLTVISKTVRCKGVSINPSEYPNFTCLDVPKLLAQHYPQHGPYLGVYAVVDAPGSMQIGSVLQLRKDV
ncbi:hypothetical protein MPSEU_000039500 [Mayamaea pseudoterrestris]|nr:hypothetical protein MPSEU_000039500 [Mayamaea pseudoterrestris]